MIIRAKTKTLFEGKALTSAQLENTNLNIEEMNCGKVLLNSLPRRLVLELTNDCNLNCVMCGRNAADFKKVHLALSWLEYFAPYLDRIEEVTLMGWGEPTVHPDFVRMLEFLDQYPVRKYFCTNGMNLKQLTPALFEHHVDVFAVSVDGASAETNDSIRRGSNLYEINSHLREIVRIKKERNLAYPYINYVFCAMRSNLHELPDLVDMAAEVGLEEVKVVFLTAFTSELLHEILYGHEDEVTAVFQEAEKRSVEKNISLKLPYIRGTDPAEDNYHRDCFVGWRDFFLGSDGYIRPCMSTSDKFLQFDPSMDLRELWNAPVFQRHRAIVNSPSEMTAYCRNCYQSSHCNWNREKTYNQTGEAFLPNWED